MTNPTLLKVSQSIVDATSNYVQGRTINIINPEGIIIASSDSARIGTFHAGGLEVAKTGRTVEITTENKASYKGAKEGINSPLFKDGEFLGTVGIYGNPDEVREAAALLSICVKLYLKQAQSIERSLLQKSHRDEILEILMSENNADPLQLLNKATALGANLVFPLLPIVCTLNKNSSISISEYGIIHHALCDAHIVNRNADIVIEYPKGIIILKSSCQNPEQFLDMLESFSTPAGIKVTAVAAGISAQDIHSLWYSLHLAQRIIDTGKLQKGDAAKPDHFIFTCFTTTSQEVKTYISPKLQALVSLKSPWIFPTIESYLIHDGKIQAMADDLGIHKNTCIYRLDKILNICDLKNCREYTKAFLLANILSLYSTGNVPV
ncbi:MAG: sugar diacid recognition domain-containing protein [Sphaerochaetaceae bacterium]